MNLEGITSKIEANADKLGMAYGALSPLSAEGGLMWNIQTAIEKHDLQGAIAWLTDLNNYVNWPPGASVFKAGIMALIAGWGLKEFAPSELSKYGTPVEKAGWGMILGLPIAMFILGLAREPKNGSLAGSSSRSPSYGYGY